MASKIFGSKTVAELKRREKEMKAGNSVEVQGRISLRAIDRAAKRVKKK